MLLPRSKDQADACAVLERLCHRLRLL